VANAELRPGERARIDAALADLKAVLPGTDRKAIADRLHALNEATHHLAEVMMNRSVQTALTGKDVNEV
jgi:molecular chaperone HscA